MRWLPVTLALALTTTPSFAQAPSRADTLFREGREAMKVKDYDTACSRFAESQKLDPAPGTLLNLADCEERVGRFAAAFRHVRDALVELPAKDERTAIAKERLVALGRRVSHVTVRLGEGAPQGTRVSQDGEELAPPLLGKEHPIDAGAHAFVLTLPDGRTHRLEVTLREGESRAVVLDPPPPAPPPPPPPSARPAPSATPARPVPPKPRPGRDAAPYVFLAVGGAGAVVSAVTAAFLLQKKSIVDRDCNRDTRICGTQEGVDAAKTGSPLVPLFYGAAVVGLAGLTTGTILLWNSDDGAVTAFLSPATAGVRGRFLCGGSASRRSSPSL